MTNGFPSDISEIAKIALDYETACNAANRLNASAETCHQINQQMRSAASSVPNALAGAAADLLISSMTDWSKRMDSVTDDLERLATLITTTAERIAAADRTIAEAASGLGVGGMSSGAGSSGGGGGGYEF